MSIRSLLLINFFVHLLFASFLPLSNDEAYYWDWGQNLHLSFKDHPPGISWLTSLSDMFGFGVLKVRLLSPFLHTLTLFFGFKTLDLATKQLGKKPSFILHKSLFFLFLTSPGLSLIGSVSIPDIGLMAAIQALCFCLLLWVERERLSMVDGIIAGLCLGLAGLFKYHALPLAFGLMLGFIWVRRKTIDQDIGFYILSALLGALLCMPVWIWNSLHDWASFRYQAAHGFSSGSWSLILPLQAIVAITILIGPGVIWVIGLAKPKFKKDQISPAEAVVLPAFVILLGLILLAALRKPILPHWTMPAFALALPVALARISPKKLVNALRFQYVYGGIIGVMVLVLSISFTSPEKWLKQFDGDPKYLSELTVWDPLAAVLEKELQERQLSQGDDACSGPLYIAAPRWYAVSQLQYRLRLKQGVQLVSDDPNDYYSLRDKDLWPKVCQLAVVLGPRQSIPESLLAQFKVKEEKKLDIKFHEKLDWRLVILRNRSKKRDL